MAGSVWYAQVNKALKDLIPTIVKTYDRNKVLVPVTAIVRTPEPEFKVEKFPSATIFSYDEKFAQNRYSDERVVVAVDQQRGVAVIEESAKPYNLFYQIDFWASFQEDIDTMTMLWGSKFAKHNLLAVKDTLGVNRVCKMKLIKIAKADTVKNKDERVFRRIYSYEIWVELDETAQVEEPIVLTKEINMKEVD